MKTKNGFFGLPRWSFTPWSTSYDSNIPLTRISHASESLPSKMLHDRVIRCHVIPGLPRTISFLTVYHAIIRPTTLTSLCRSSWRVSKRVLISLVFLFPGCRVHTRTCPSQHPDSSPFHISLISIACPIKLRDQSSSPWLRTSRTCRMPKIKRKRLTRSPGWLSLARLRAN